MKTVTAQDRSNLIKLAHSLPKGDATRRAILAGLNKLVKKAAEEDEGGLSASDVADAMRQGMPSKRVHIGPEDLMNYAQKTLGGEVSREDLKGHFEEAVEILIKDGALKIDGKWGLLITP